MRDMSDAAIAGRLYGPATEPAVKPAAPAPEGSTRSPAPADTRGLLPADDRLQAMAEKFYGKTLPGLENVRFDEPPQGTFAALGNTQRIPQDQVVTPADQAELVQVQKTWHGLGFGISQAEALWSATLDARRHVFTAEEGRRELARMYGPTARQKEVDAGRLFADMRREWPNAESWIRKVGNDPRVVALFAERQARRSR